MKLGFISTLALNNSLRASTLNKQTALNSAQIEVSTGKHADMGRELGAFTSAAISLDTQLSLIDQTKVTNGLTANRISTMQLGLQTTVEAANDFIGQISAEISNNLDGDLIKTIGSSALDQIHSNFNVTFRGEYLFSGLNSDAKALVDYEGADGVPAKTAVQNAFVATFGFAVTDPAASSVTPTDLQNFLDGAFADLFNDANWEGLWTGASERGIRSKISLKQFTENSTTAHDQVFREVTAASVMIAEFSQGQLNPSALDQLAQSSVEKMSQSIGLIGKEQSKMGVIEEQIRAANDQLDFQENVLTTQLSNLTEVDAYEAALQLRQITTSLEASYATTARIQSLSLLNFL
ncbi:MAG: flagellar hook-associated family protein [Pseudomonadota bacterium]